jgi:hypothetical protein
MSGAMKIVPARMSALTKPVVAVYARRWLLGGLRHLAAQTKSNHCDLIKVLLLGLGFSHLHKTFSRPGDNGFNLDKILYRKAFKISRNQTQLTLLKPTKGGEGYRAIGSWRLAFRLVRHPVRHSFSDGGSLGVGRPAHHSLGEGGCPQPAGTG